jgi:hypothetical protein
LQPDTVGTAPTFRRNLICGAPRGGAIMRTHDELIAIPAPTERDEPFKIGDALSIYEAAMVYAGRHPYPYFFDVKGRGIEEHLEFLRLGLAQSSSRKRVRAQRSWDICSELIIRIERGQIRPTKTAYDARGKIDMSRTQIRTSDLADLAKERDETPRYLRHLLINPVSDESATVQTKAKIATRPARDFAKIALNEIYPEGIPSQSEEPNAALCRKVGNWLKSKQRKLSDATILRAAGRRRS